MSALRPVKYVRIRVKFIGIVNFSVRPLAWFVKTYPSEDQRAQAILSGEVVPLDEFQQPIPPQDAMMFLTGQGSVSGAFSADGSVSPLRRPADVSAPFTDVSVSDFSSSASPRTSMGTAIGRVRTNVGLNPPYTYLAHSQADTDMASRIRSDLKEAGFQVWSLEDLLGGQPWEATMRYEMAKSTCVVLLLSEKVCEQLRGAQPSEVSIALQFYREEVERNPKSLIPVQIDECTIPDVPLGRGLSLTSLVAIHLFPEESWSRSMAKLIMSLQPRPA